jgi:hypothetical protein
VNAASIISLSSEGSVGRSLRAGRVGRVKLAYVGNPPRFIFINPPWSYTANAYLPITALGAGAEVGPCGVTSTQSGAVKLDTGVESIVVSVAFARGIK